MARTMQHFVDNVEATPVIVLACLKLHHEESLEMGGHVFPACQNLLLAARALGYGGVLTGWHKVVDAELREVIGMPADPEWRIAACITLGVPAGHHGPVRRRPLAELVYEDRWEQPAPWAQDPEGARFSASGPPRRG